MHRLAGWSLILAMLLTAGCEDSHSHDIVDGVPTYLSATSPVNVISNLEQSYRRREIEQYAKLLAPEFQFKFQPQDVLDLGRELLTRSEDSTGTSALFRTAEVANISIDLTFGQSQPANDVNLPEDAMKIRINQVQLQVDETTGTS